MSSAIVHLAIPAGNLEETLKFYTDVLGCSLGNSEKGRWQDVNFWGNELTLHQSEERLPNVRHDVDMGAVLVPHFGVHLTQEDFDGIKDRIAEAGLTYIDEPYRRFEGGEYEQETFFIADPNGNVLEIKTMKNPEVLWPKS
ncbi:VOC family protein [Parvularcula maris]|uniref:VOC family protein n=1 Tax=Parvularcula maris TaxID=2965077 RepID=A0A9X2L8Y3_9PROT|nr:VOC family protein [Parvularcula maris]MCQ8185271.1 VOC family protein [Parvularcula maris]